MRVTVKLFGSVRESAGAKELSVELDDGAPVSALRRKVEAEAPALAALGARARIAVNQEVQGGDPVLADGDEVAFLPPVAGGGGDAAVWISERPLDEAEVAARVRGPDAGGVVTFVGAVRDRSRGHAIEHLEYEAYAGMAERELAKIVAEAGQRWPGTRVAIAHRVGHLEVGDLAVVVAAAAPHRAEAFDACRFAIDTLKQTVPIWKKEVTTDGAYWVDDHA